jgi:hypothetical protein
VAEARPRRGFALGLSRLDSLGVAPQEPACAVGVLAVIGGGDVQRAGSGAGGQLGVEVAAGPVV